MDKNQDLIIQSYFTVAFVTELKNNDFLNSECYRNMKFEDTFLKDNLPQIGIDNRGALLIFLYAMLVVPKELIEQELPSEFRNFNSLIEQIKSQAYSTYESDAENINYLRHIRNAVAHANVEFSENDVEFIDKNNSGSQCNIKIPLDRLGQFLEKLQKIIISYLKQNYKN